MVLGQLKLTRSPCNILFAKLNRRMAARKDKSLIKLYKDLMITRRDLIDLRESINNTINSIKESDQRIRVIEDDRKRKQTAQYHPRPFSHQVTTTFQLKLKAKCAHCSLAFANNEELELHRKEKHQICDDCRKEYSDDLGEHLEFTCGQAKVECEGCRVSIRKAELNAHVKVCCYRQCYKCAQQVYFKAYAFHLQECKRSQNLIPPCRQFHRPKFTDRSLALPCCLVP